MKGTLTQSAQKQRVIRVFISSTFRDMKEEREELVKRVFPKLRRICEKRGVIWGEVDLRWGITDEQKAEGKVLPICLKEIQECRPYFIGMLGEKYGWIPLEISEELVELEPWLAEHREKSVTELEVLHGVLNNPEMADHAYFYFRDPRYVYSLPADRREEHLEGPTPEEIEELGRDDAESRTEKRRKKLVVLKDQIRASGLPVRENYKDPHALGELVLQDFTKLIDELYPEGEELDPLDREAAEHEAFAQSRFKVYIGRDEYFDRLDKHVQGDSQPLVVLGESGSGKSALLANWAARCRQNHPDDFLLMHFIGATPYSADWATMLKRIMGEFKKQFDIKEDIPTEPDKLRSAFANWLHMANARIGDGRVVLILDALNQLEDRDNAPDLVWLPPFIPEKIRLILSTLPGRPLDDLKKREWPTMEVKLLEDAERKQLIRDYLAQYRKSLSSERVEKIASAEQTRNPLFLRALLEELRLFGEHALLDERIDHYVAAEKIDDLYERILERYEEDYDRDRPGLVRDSMTLLWAARRGLSESELLDLLGEGGESLPVAVFAPLYLAAEHSLVSRSGLIGFFHDYMRKAVEDRYLPTAENQQKRHLHLAEYFATLELSPRAVDELPWQLAEAESWQGLCDLLADLEFFEQAWQENQFEVKRYWVKIEDTSFLRLVDAYKPVLDAPDEVHDSEKLVHVSSLLDDTGHLSEALSLWQLLAERYQQAGDLKSQASCLRCQGVTLWQRSDLEGAMELYKQAECISRELGDLRGLSAALGNQGIILSQRGDPDGAMVLYKEQERISRELEDRDSLMRSLGNQGIILRQRADLEGAMELYKQAERISRELGDAASLSICLGNQAVVLIHRGNLDEAMALSKEQERICREIRNSFGLRMSLINQGNILYDRGDLDGAIALEKEVERICRELGDLDALPISLNNQGSILKDRGDLDKAEALFEEAEHICRELGNLDSLQVSLGNQGEILKERGDLDGAMVLYKEQERICRELGYLEGLAISLVNQGELLAAKGQAKDALLLAEEAYRLATDHGCARIAEYDIKPILDKIRSQLE